MTTPMTPLSMDNLADRVEYLAMMDGRPSQIKTPLTVGSLVLVHGLKKAPHLNRRRGIIVSDLKKDGRWGVELFPKSRSTKQLAIKGSNLMPQIKLEVESTQEKNIIIQCANRTCTTRLVLSAAFWCSHCKMERYCSRKCQQKDWKNRHSKQCQTYRDLRKKKTIAADTESFSREDYNQVYLLGRQLYERGNYAAAEQVYQEGIEKFMGFPIYELYFGLGNVQNAAQKYDQAVQSMWESLRLFEMQGDEEGAKVHQTNLANFLKNQGDYESSMEVYQKVLQQEPANTTVLDTIGHLLVSMGKCQEAATHYRQALPFFEKQHGTNPVILANVYGNLCQAAIHSLRQRIEKIRMMMMEGTAPSDTVVRGLQNETKELLAFAKKGMKLDPRNTELPAIHQNLVFMADRLH